MTPEPPLTALPQLQRQLAGAGWAVVDADALVALCGVPATAAWQGLLPEWDNLPPDRHLLDGGHYRRRRHGSFRVTRDGVQAAPPRPHWQPLDYNALHGGRLRWFEPLPPAWSADAAWSALLQGLAGVADGLRGPREWAVEAHAFRIDCSGGIGRPTPEGAHRDGVDLVAVILVGRHGIKGGETRVFDAAGPNGVRFTLARPWSALLIDDERVIHETTPIQPVEPGQAGWRDTLVLTYRSGGFLDPPAPG